MRSNAPRQSSGGFSRSATIYCTGESGKRRRHHSMAAGAISKAVTTKPRRQFLGVVAQAAANLERPPAIACEVVLFSPRYKQRIGLLARPGNHLHIVLSANIQLLKHARGIASLQVLGDKLHHLTVCFVHLLSVHSRSPGTSR